MVVCSNRQASDVTCTDQARCWWPAKLGNISTAFLCPLDTRFHRKQRHFVRKGFGVVVAASSGRCAAGRARTGLVRPGMTMKHNLAAWRSMAVFHPSGISAMAAIRTPDGWSGRPSSRLFTSRAAQSDKFTPSVRESGASGRPGAPCRTQVPRASKLRRIYRVYFVINSGRPVVPLSTYTIHHGIFTRFFVKSTISHCS